MLTELDHKVLGKYAESIAGGPIPVSPTDFNYMGRTIQELRENLAERDCTIEALREEVERLGAKLLEREADIDLLERDLVIANGGWPDD